jgi:hypothetical protein
VDAGDTFLRTDNDRHLWIVLSDPAVDPDTVLLVNLTSYDSRKERACILMPGDHEWVCKETCVNYQDAVVTSSGLLDDARIGGAIRLLSPLTGRILQKVRNGVLDSERMSLDHANIVIDQGLVDFEP